MAVLPERPNDYGMMVRDVDSLSAGCLYFFGVVYGVFLMSWRQRWGCPFSFLVSAFIVHDNSPDQPFVCLSTINTLLAGCRSVVL